MLRLSPTALRAYLACPRSFWLSHIARAPKLIPPYVLGGRALDEAAQRWLTDGTNSDTDAELAALKPELPAPGVALVQHRLDVPCPGLEDSVSISGILDYMTPPVADPLIVVGDVKRIYHQDAAMSAEKLKADVQALTYVWLVYRTYAPPKVILRWSYLVRQTVSKEGKVTRKPRAFSVDVEVTRAEAEAWFAEVVVPAAHGMLAVAAHSPEPNLLDAGRALVHDPESCQDGGRCFVSSSCALFRGPLKESNTMDLSKFKTGAAAPRIAINPPPMQALTVVEAPSCETDTASTPLDVGTVEGPGAALLEAVPDTEPAPAPELAPKPARRRRKTEALTPISPPAEATWPTLESASTEAIMSELADRGWHVQLTGRS